MHLTFGVSVLEARLRSEFNTLEMCGGQCSAWRSLLRVLQVFSVNIIHTHLHQHVPLSRSTNGWSLENLLWSAKEYAPLTLILNPCILSSIYVCASYDSHDKHQLFSKTISTGWSSVNNINRLAVLMDEDCITRDRNRILKYKLDESSCHVVNIHGGVPPTNKSKQLLPSRTILYSTVTYHRLHVTKIAVAQLVETLRYKPGGRGFDSRWCHWNFLLT